MVLTSLYTYAYLPINSYYTVQYISIMAFFIVISLVEITR